MNKWFLECRLSVSMYACMIAHPTIKAVIKCDNVGWDKYFQAGFLSPELENFYRIPNLGPALLQFLISDTDISLFIVGKVYMWMNI
jgi:hypothetical protein